MCGTEERVSRMSEVCWHCLRCHWYCDDVLEECRGQSEPCHEFKLCMEDIEKMKNKFEDRLVNVNDVIEAVDKHTREDETLDEDISVILEEVKTAFDKEKVIEELEYDKEMSAKYSTGLREQGHIEAFDEAISIVKKDGINNILL